ncbi:glycosyltransferase [Rhizobium sp. F40D2]
MSPSSRMMGTRAILARRLIGLAFKFISSRSCSHFTFETQHDREIFLNQGLVKPENSTVIKGAGVDPELFYAKSQEDFTLPLKFLFASRLLKSKGLEAFLIAADRYADQAVVKFVVAGMVEPEDPDGYSATELADNSSITFLGEETDMPSLLRKVDLVCLPTLYGEGIPRILIEASACGVASLATDVAGCNEVVKNGKTGFLIRAGKPTEMADEIESILIQYVESPKLLRDHSEAALALFQSGDFSQASVTGRFIELLKVA